MENKFFGVDSRLVPAVFVRFVLGMFGQLSLTKNVSMLI